MIEFVNNKEFETCPHCGKAKDCYGLSTMSLQTLYCPSEKKVMYYLLCVQCKWHTLLRETTDELLEDLKQYSQILKVANIMLDYHMEKAEEYCNNIVFPPIATFPNIPDERYVKIQESRMGHEGGSVAPLRRNKQPEMS